MPDFLFCQSRQIWARVHKYIHAGMCIYACARPHTASTVIVQPQNIKITLMYT